MNIIVGCLVIMIISLVSSAIITIWIDDTYIIYPGAVIPIAPGEYIKIQTMLSNGLLYCTRIRYYYDINDEYHENIIHVGYSSLEELEAEFSDFLGHDIKLYYKREVNKYEKRS